MEKYLVVVASGIWGRLVPVVIEAQTLDEARFNVAHSHRTSVSQIKSVKLVRCLVDEVVTVPERHPRKNWICLHIKGWNFYKADLDVTQPEKSIMVSCSDPQIFKPTDRELYKSIILEYMQKHPVENSNEREL